MNTAIPSLLLAGAMLLCMAPVAAAEKAAPWGQATLVEWAYTPQKAVYDVAVSSTEELEGVIDRVSFQQHLPGQPL